MKFTPDQIRRLETECNAVLAKHNLSPSRINTTARAWEVFHAAKAYWVYKDPFVNDSHIETALCHIYSIKRVK